MTRRLALRAFIDEIVVGNTGLRDTRARVGSARVRFVARRGASGGRSSRDRIGGGGRDDVPRAVRDVCILGYLINSYRVLSQVALHASPYRSPRTQEVRMRRGASVFGGLLFLWRRSQSRRFFTSRYGCSGGIPPKQVCEPITKLAAEGYDVASGQGSRYRGRFSAMAAIACRV